MISIKTLSKKFNTKRFNDGLLDFGTYDTERDESGAKKGKVFKSKGTAYFENESIRQSDVEMYHSKHSTVSLKVSTYFVPGVEESLKVKIDNVLYELLKIDPTKDRKLMYWYLGKLGDLEDGIKLRDSR